MSPVSNKIALFIDGANLYATAKTLGFDIDYKRLLKEFQSRGTLLRAFYYTEHIDQMVLFSGDGDFRSLVEAVQRHGVHVTVVSTISSQPPLIADELRREADVFTDLVELKSKIARDPSERAAPREPRYHAPQFLQRATTTAPRDDDDDFDD